MNTNKIVLQSVDQFMSGYTPVYKPLYPLFMRKSQAFSEQAGDINFKRVHTVGDIRGAHVSPKSTHIQQIAVNEAKKTFSKYFLANQFIQSNLQSSDGNPDVIAQVLDEHQKQADDLFLQGGGSSNATVINNGLFWSKDPNHTVESSVEIAVGGDSDHLKPMHQAIMTTVTQADDVSGDKALILYGTTAISKFNSLYANTDAPFRRVLADVLGQGWTIAKMPSAVTPSGNGWITANLDQVKLNYTTLPTLKDQGVNAEKMYTWHNFLMGSMMLDVLAKDGVLRQPVTFA